MAEYIKRANLIARIKYYITHTPEGGAKMDEGLKNI